ncbi:non-homologous end-joining DNA ligase [Pseudonocardia sp. H11422]|uniref:non-homologous end-joining DNA ligase n=1 Tax=Pseudonocardia sp. H11422 TaxID=2835866 RepID=UPI001BDD1BFC|nr:non-homologous end-joining DNA ligase [Pseudonocardia sp. H11422]
MLATPGALPNGPEWVYEVKWDGMRLLADIADGGVRLTSRTGRNVTDDFPELSGLSTLVPDAVLDGEVVLLDDGVPSFAALADRMHGPVTAVRADARPVVFMVFDILRLYGVPLLERPLGERRATLERLALDGVPAAELSPLYTDGDALLAATAQRGMEGIVAKLLDAPYRPGQRSPSWVKVTHRRSQSCLVAGWKPERTSPSRIGALLLGVPGPHDALQFVGRVGSGLAADAVQRVLRGLLDERSVILQPFPTPLPRADAMGTHWCRPELVVEVAHLGWTAAGRLRQPVFRGIREDVDPAEIDPRR